MSVLDIYRADVAGDYIELTDEAQVDRLRRGCKLSVLRSLLPSIMSETIRITKGWG